MLFFYHDATLCRRNVNLLYNTTLKSKSAMAKRFTNLLSCFFNVTEHIYLRAEWTEESNFATSPVEKGQDNWYCE